MNLSLRNRIIRCRPLLGTFVEISIDHENAQEAHQIIGLAFKAIEQVHQQMSFYDLNSEVSRLNQLAYKQDVWISPQTYQVISCAKKMYELSEGIFDITVAVKLLNEGFLPRHEFLRGLNDNRARSSDIMLVSSNRVRFIKPLCIDLGGIAKGFAVDEAVRVLQELGIQGGLVNAGGDLRCFGQEEHPIHVRHPRMAGIFVSLPVLKDSALATSANSYDQTEYENHICSQIDGRTRDLMFRSFSVSVCAQSCMIADALTKIVLARQEKSIDLLKKLDAKAFIVDEDQQVICLQG